MQPITLLKLGGSLITDKLTPETYRAPVAERIAGEIVQSIPLMSTPLIIGHGSGSFGHVVGNKYGTFHGVVSSEQWHGWAEVALTAAHLNMLFADTLKRAGLPVFRFQASASARAVDNVIAEMNLTVLQTVLEKGLNPLIYGDVALDDVRGGTIISTETIFTYLVSQLNVGRIVLVGEVDGVYDTQGAVIPEITPQNFEAIRPALGGSGGVDVTGGMLTKVSDMLAVAKANTGLQIHVINGITPGTLHRCLSGQSVVGTIIHDGQDG